jgi:hypothetical protein
VSEPHGGEPDHEPPAGSTRPSDPLDGLREAVDTVDELPVGERVAVFERVNDGIATELARLDEV